MATVVGRTSDDILNLVSDTIIGGEITETGRLLLTAKNGAVMDIGSVSDSTSGISLSSGIDDIVNFNSEYGSGFVSLDEEFSRSNFPNTFPAGFVAVNPGSGPTSVGYEEKYGAGAFTYRGPAASGDQYRMIVKSMSGAPSDWTAFSRLTFGGPWQFINTFGLIFRDSVSGKFFHMSRFVNQDQIEIAYWDNPTTLNTVYVSGWGIGAQSSGVIYRVKKVGTTYTFSASLDDGVTWHVIGSWVIDAFTPNQFGIGGNVTAAAPSDITVACHWLRLR